MSDDRCTLSAVVDEEDFSGSPGREANLKEVVFAQFGAQSLEAGAGSKFLADLKALFALENGPSSFERCHHRDAQGYHEDILMAYWTNADNYREWARARPFAAWWDALPLEGPVGYWREILKPEVDRFGLLGFGLNKQRRVGCLHASKSIPTEKFGYWGGYRDRFAASASDRFDPAESQVRPLADAPETHGQRVKVTVPKNLLFVREGAETTYLVDPTARREWDEKVKPVFDKWIAYLRDNPELSGALCVRDTVEQDIRTGADYEKYNTLIYFQSLRHMERAARTQPSHLALYNSYMAMMIELGALGINPEAIIWAEAHILSPQTAEMEYVNCHEKTGLLPYFRAS